MRRPTLLFAVPTLVGVLALPAAAAAKAKIPGAFRTPVQFKVKNVNRTLAPACTGDGSTRTIRGTLTTPSRGKRPKTVALYYHGLSYGSFFFEFTGVPGYDFGAEMARRGHASIVVDRLGYDRSEGPDGNFICYGTQADIADQIIGQVRRGSYKRPGKAVAPAFKKVALAGHSAGGFIAEMAQYSFGSADALAVLSYADQGSGLPAATALSQAQLRCATAPERSDGDVGAPNYAFFGQTPADFRAAHFGADTDEDVFEKVLARRNRDPCGDLNSIGPSLALNQVGIRSISSPILVVTGEKDALFPPPAGELQARGYPSSNDVTQVTLPGAPHALTLSPQRGAFIGVIDGWLKARGF